jgi:hypothetical protein
MYIGGQVLGIVATFCLFFLTYTPRIYVVSIFSGIMYSTIMTFPYLLLVRYHKTDVVRLRSIECFRNDTRTEMS